MGRSSATFASTSATTRASLCAAANSASSRRAAARSASRIFSCSLRSSSFLPSTSTYFSPSRALRYRSSAAAASSCAAATRFTMLWRSSISRAMRSSARSLARRSSSALTSATRRPSRSIVTAFCRRIMDSSMVAIAIDFSVALIMSVSASWSLAWSVARSCSICCAAVSFFFGGSGGGEAGGGGAAGGGDAAGDLFRPPPNRPSVTGSGLMGTGGESDAAIHGADAFAGDVKSSCAATYATVVSGAASAGCLPQWSRPLVDAPRNGDEGASSPLTETPGRTCALAAQPIATARGSKPRREGGRSRRRARPERPRGGARQCARPPRHNDPSEKNASSPW